VTSRSPDPDPDRDPDRDRPRARIGTSGFRNDHRRGPFYPEDLPKRDWLAWYVERFDLLEINNTFYGLPDADTVDAWRDAAPEGFIYVPKYSRYGSHMKRLKSPREHLDSFLEPIERLGPRLGPILVQLPPRWRANRPRLEDFLEAVADVGTGDHRWIIEFRDRDRLRDEIFDLLRELGAGLCIHDMIEDHPRIATRDLAYLRFHGDRYRGGYSPQALSGAARRMRRHLDEGRDAFAAFNNDEGGHAAINALDLRRFINRS